MENKLLKLTLTVLSLATLCGCVSGGNNYPESKKQEYITFVKRKGKQQGNYYYYFTGKNPFYGYEYYAIYDQSADKFGYCCYKVDTGYSSTAQSVIEIDYLALYSFFEAGKPWEAKINVYNRRTNYDDLKKRYLIYDFQTKRNDWDFGTHELKFRSDSYMKTLNVTVCYLNNGVLDNADFSFYLDKIIGTLQSLHLEHFSTGLPFLF